MAESTAIDQTRLHDAWKAAQWTFAPLMPSDITKAVCVSYAHSRRKEGRSDGTIRKELSSVRAAVNWHDEQNTAKWWLPDPPPPKERWLTRDEMHALLEASRDTYHLFVFLHLALATAGRKEALFQMKWMQVRWAEDRIFLGFKPGGKKRPTVPMTNTLRVVLQQAYSVARTDHVIEYADRPVKSIRTSLQRACKIAGLTGVTPHVLRHSAAVWMRMNDVSIEKLSAYMGHSDTRVTERVYAKYGPDYLDGTTDALEL